MRDLFALSLLDGVGRKTLSRVALKMGVHAPIDVYLDELGREEKERNDLPMLTLHG